MPLSCLSQIQNALFNHNQLIKWPSTDIYFISPCTWPLVPECCLKSRCRVWYLIKCINHRAKVITYSIIYSDSKMLLLTRAERAISTKTYGKMRCCCIHHGMYILYTSWHVLDAAVYIMACIALYSRVVILLDLGERVTLCYLVFSTLLHTLF